MTADLAARIRTAVDRLEQWRTKGDDAIRAAATGKPKLSPTEIARAFCPFRRGVPSAPCATHHGMITTMSLDDWWAKLPQTTREWLIAHNGEPLPDNVASTVRDAGTTFDHAAWWEDSGTTITLADRAIDWIEAVANDEDPAGL